MCRSHKLVNAEIYNQYIDKLKKNGNNEIYLIHQFILLNIHCHNYSRAFNSFYKFALQTRFQKLPSSNVQTFQLLESYIQFLLNIGKINITDTEIDTSRIKKFRINKFLNDVPVHSKLKTGSNIAILIIHVLFLLTMKKHNTIIDRVEALNQYCYRYLRNDESFRYNCFIKMLIQMTKADFNRIRTERYTVDLHKRLKANPMMQSGIALETEIIPYEDLWEMVLDLLE